MRIVPVILILRIKASTCIQDTNKDSINGTCVSASIDGTTARIVFLNGPISQTLLFLAAPTLMLGIVQALMPLMDGLFIN